MTKHAALLTTLQVFAFAGPTYGAGEKAPLDIYGDPLPPGATARFGSLRWRIPKAVNAVAISPNGKLVGAVNMDGKVSVWDKEQWPIVASILGFHGRGGFPGVFARRQVLGNRRCPRLQVA
jgi:WD40 repeat protein